MKNNFVLSGLNLMGIGFVGRKKAQLTWRKMRRIRLSGLCAFALFSRFLDREAAGYKTGFQPKAVGGIT